MDYKKELSEAIAEAAGLSPEDMLSMIEIPADIELGDYAFPCFRLAKQFKKAPEAIAEELSKKLRMPSFISGIKTVGAYINFFLEKQLFIKNTLLDVKERGENFGGSSTGRGLSVCIDYSSINIAKPFHIGHLSSTVIGNSLYKIYEFLGYKPIGINHLGDWGTQFGKLIAAYKRWGNKEEIEKNSVSAMLDLYVKFHEEAGKDDSLNEEGRAWFKKIEDGDEEAVSIFNWFKELTLTEAQVIYDMLGIKFDSYAGESFYNDKMQPVIDELKKKNLLELSEGAYVVKLDKFGLVPCMIIKSDGATLYATRDLAAAFYRKKTYDFYKCLYVVAYQQNLHFNQLFRVIELMGYKWSKDLEHVAFGMVSLEDCTLSTRKGNVIFLKDVLDKAVEKTLKIIHEKSPGLTDKEEVAKVVGIGAVVFDTLSAARIKDISFSFDRVLNFDGETGPYVQYTHARCASLLRYADFNYLEEQNDFSALDNDESFAVAKLLYSFPYIVELSCEKNEPYLITKHITELAKAMNKFYYEHRIITQDKPGSAARLLLADCVKTVIKTGLGLLGIGAPDRM